MLELLHDDLDRPEFELVEVTEPQRPATGGGDFLGYDLSAGLGLGSSLLSWGLSLPEPDVPARTPTSTLGKLIEDDFRPQLNGAGLFSSLEVAESCLASMAALQAFAPGTYESDFTFEVVAVHDVPPASGGPSR